MNGPFSRQKVTPVPRADIPQSAVRPDIELEAGSGQSRPPDRSAEPAWLEDFTVPSEYFQFLFGDCDGRPRFKLDKFAFERHLDLDYDSVLVMTTTQHGEVGVRVESWLGKPPLDQSADQIVEVSIEIHSGALKFARLPNDILVTSRLDRGWYRVRVSAANLSSSGPTDPLQDRPGYVRDPALAFDPTAARTVESLGWLARSRDMISPIAQPSRESLRGRVHICYRDRPRTMLAIRDEESLHAPGHRRGTDSRHQAAPGGHGRTPRRGNWRSGGHLRSCRDTRGYATNTVRDREDEGSNPSPPTIFVFKIGDSVGGREPADHSWLTISWRTIAT